MRILPLILALFFVFSSCKKREVPRRYIQPPEMESILWDLMRTDQFLADFVLNKDTGLNKRKESTKMYNQVLAIHKVSRDEFTESFNFYRSRPLLIKRMMDSINKKMLTPAVTPAQPLPPVRVEDTLKPERPAEPARPLEPSRDTARPRIRKVSGVD